jgi:hypothetical protein
MTLEINKLPGFHKLYVVTWSKSQDCFHHDQIEDMLFANWDVFYGKNPLPSDWIVVGFADNAREANSLIRSLKKRKSHFKEHGKLPLA